MLLVLPIVMSCCLSILSYSVAADIPLSLGLDVVGCYQLLIIIIKVIMIMIIIIIIKMKKTTLTLKEDNNKHKHKYGISIVPRRQR